MRVPKATSFTLQDSMRAGRKVWEGDRTEGENDTNSSCASLSFCKEKNLPRCLYPFTLEPMDQDGATLGNTWQRGLQLSSFRVFVLSNMVATSHRK